MRIYILFFLKQNDEEGAFYPYQIQQNQVYGNFHPDLND
jgi:hypothetical protein